MYQFLFNRVQEQLAKAKNSQQQPNTPKPRVIKETVRFTFSMWATKHPVLIYLFNSNAFVVGCLESVHIKKRSL